MKEWVFAVGIILLFFGLFSMALSNISALSYPAIVARADVMDNGASWEVSANFSKGDYITADYRIHPGWAREPYETSPDYFPGISYKLIFLQISPPDGGNATVFATVLVIDTIKVQASGFLAVTVVERGTGLSVKNVSEVSGVPAEFINKTMGGEPIEDLPDPWIVGGIAKYNGIYRLRVLGPYPTPIVEPGETVEPPDYLALGKMSLETPLHVLLPVGAAVTISAIALVVWSRRKPK